MQFYYLYLDYTTLTSILSPIESFSDFSPNYSPPKSITIDSNKLSIRSKTSPIVSSYNPITPKICLPIYRSVPSDTYTSPIPTDKSSLPSPKSIISCLNTSVNVTSF